MPLNLTHNHFGDYTPVSRTPSGFKGPTPGTSGDPLWGQDELDDRPHFGLEGNHQDRVDSGRLQVDSNHFK